MKQSNLMYGLVLLLLFVAGCKGEDETERVNWRVTMGGGDDNPYGSKLIWESLPAYFPAARINSLSGNFRYTGMTRKMAQNNSDSVKLLVLHGISFNLSQKEWNALLNFMAEGNEVLLLSSTIDEKITSPLGLTRQQVGYELEEPSPYSDFGKDNRAILRIYGEGDRKFGYQGRTIGSYFRISSLENDVEDVDPDNEIVELPPPTEQEPYDDEDEDVYEAPAQPETVRPEILGYAGDEPDFVRYGIGNGHLTIHAAPLVLTNYFVLQDGNREYLDAVWHSFPANVSMIYWHSFGYHSEEDTDMNILFRHPATRNAILIAIALLIMYVLFHLRRRQRIVPVIPPLQNTSVSFVETIGKLYYNRHDHSNLAGKMIQHFLDWVRGKYNIDTSALNPAFEKSLSAKSGKSIEEVGRLVYRILQVRRGDNLSEQQLYDLHHAIQSFYNNHPA